MCGDIPIYEQYCMSPFPMTANFSLLLLAHVANECSSFFELIIDDVGQHTKVEEEI